MTPSRAIALIRECLDQGRVKVHRHFVERMVERGLFWPDVLAIVEHPNGARCDGVDSLGRPRWLVRGDIAPGLSAEFLAVLDRDEQGRMIALITIYFEDR